MIFGHYSTGWRDEENRRQAREKRRGALLGVVLVLVSACAFYGALLGWF